MSKNCLYFKGVNLCFGQKFKISSYFFFFKKGLDKLFDYVRHRKQGFLDHKNDIKLKSKNLKFRLSLFFF